MHAMIFLCRICCCHTADWKLLQSVIGLAMCTVSVILGTILFLLRDNKQIYDPNQRFVEACMLCCNLHIIRGIHINVNCRHTSQSENESYSHSRTQASQSVSFVSTTSNRSSTNTIIPFKEGIDKVTCEGEIGTRTRGELLGSGSFGHVWLAIDHRRGRMFAVKQVRMMQLHQSSHTTEKLRQLENELRTVSGLHHQNVVQYLGSCRTPTMMNIYLEFVPAGSIENLIRIYGPLDCDLR